MGPLVTLLRAEMVHGANTIVGHTTVVEPSRAFVRMDDVLAIGTAVELSLSFRGAVPRLGFRGVVTEHRPSAGPGEPGGSWFALEANSNEDGERLRALLAERPRAREIRVLMVEDSSLTREVFAYAAAAHAPLRVHFETVSDAEVAWTELQTHSYHLLLVDHFLPLSTGADLITRVRTDPKLHAIPIVGLSIGGRIAREAMIEAGVDVFLEKPVKVGDLLTTLAHLTALGEDLPA